MAHYKPIAGIENITGALSKKKIQGVIRMTVTRVKSVKDPRTGEVIGYGPKEIFAQERRDYGEHPMTAGEIRQRGKWKDACRMAGEIIHNPDHPRYTELYLRWRAHAESTDQPMQFPNFVRAVLTREA